MKRNILKKILVYSILLIVLFSGNLIAYSYFDSLISNTDETVYLGDWWHLGTPISSTQEFYNAVTNPNSNSADVYYLTEDLDFTGFDWYFNSTLENIIFRGTLDGMGHKISNLSIYTNEYFLDYFGMFARMDGATVKNIKFDNVHLEMGNSALYYSRMETGLISGSVIGGHNVIENITINNSGVVGSSYYGVGGLVGQVYNSNTSLDISDIKTTNFKVFNTDYITGGLVGYIYSSGASVNVNDVDLEVEVYSNSTSGYTGGVIGRIRSGAYFTINRAIIDMSCQNTQVSLMNYGSYTGRYIGGIIGYNQSQSGVYINDVFFTGSLLPYTSRYRNYVGTIIGRNSGTYNATNTFYAQVEFLNSSGNIVYTPDRPYGEMSTVVDYYYLPSITWWNSFYLNFSNTNDLWNQDDTGRLYLIR